MTKLIKMLPTVLLAVAAVAQDNPAADPVSGAREVFKQWIETGQTLARTEAAWAEERELLQQAVEAFEREIKSLDAAVDKTESGRSEAAKAKNSVDTKVTELDAAIARAREIVAGLEKKLLALLASLPEPVVAKVQPFIARIPKDPETKATLPERVQNLVGILNEVDKFNAAITVESEIRRNPAGAEIQVSTLYLGLAQAYFTDREGQYAGYGVPGPDGWQWTEKSELAPQIRKAIAVYENTTPVQFVNLPVKVQ